MRCRKCGDRFDVRNPEMPPPPEAVESSRMGMDPEKEPGPPEPSLAPTVVLKVPEARESLPSPQYKYRERESHRYGRGRRTHPAGGKAAYYLAGAIVVVLGITVALLVHPELRLGLQPVSNRTSQDLHIAYSYYATTPLGGRMFVLQGSVRDIRKGSVSAPIRLCARLFNAEKGVLAEKTFLAGSNIQEIGFPAEIALDNTVLEEGWLPFVVGFFDPGVIADFAVTIEPM